MRDAGSCGGATAVARRAIHDRAGDFAGQMPGQRGQHARFPGALGAGHDRAGRHPGAGPDCE